MEYKYIQQKIGFYYKKLHGDNNMGVAKKIFCAVSWSQSYVCCLLQGIIQVLIDFINPLKNLPAFNSLLLKYCLVHTV